MKEAIAVHPNEEVRTVQDIPKKLLVRLNLGGPALDGPSDPDSVGFIDWQCVIYSSGLHAALNFIHFILEYKA